MKRSQRCPIKKRSCFIIECFLTVITISFGLVLILPFETFSNPIYSGLKGIAPEYVWGLIFAIAGVYQLITMVLKRKSILKMIGFSLLTFLWSFSGTAILVNDIMHSYLSTGFTNYLCIAGLSFYMSYMMGGD